MLIYDFRALGEDLRMKLSCKVLLDVVEG